MNEERLKAALDRVFDGPHPRKVIPRLNQPEIGPPGVVAAEPDDLASPPDDVERAILATMRTDPRVVSRISTPRANSWIYDRLMSQHRHT